MNNVFQQINTVRLAVVGLICALLCAFAFQPALNLFELEHITRSAALNAGLWGLTGVLIGLAFLVYLLVETKPLLRPLQD